MLLSFLQKRRRDNLDFKEVYVIFKIQFAGDISRILYFMPSDSGFVLLHGFIKKTDKTPVAELETAKARMNDFKRRVSE